MKPKNSLLSILLLLLSMHICLGQTEQFDYWREIRDAGKNWHKITLPTSIFAKTSNDLSDIRVFGITEEGDTIQAPYILQIAKETVHDQKVPLKVLNISANENGYYFTFQLENKLAINRLALDFSNLNFDWKVSLEGSQDQREWFSILEDYRILSIKNEHTDYAFSTLVFPEASFRFFRLHVKSKEKPLLRQASTSRFSKTEGTLSHYSISSQILKEDRAAHQTILTLSLPQPVPVSRLKATITDSVDYYRPLTIEYVSDSLNTPEGWIYRYEVLATETLNSLSENEFKFNSTITNKLKLVIYNGDNEPLSYGRIEISGYEHSLAVRFSQQANYFLAYGNPHVLRPNYDIDQFADQIPEVLPTVSLGEERTLRDTSREKNRALFENPNWLWGLMALIILTMGWFTMKMIRKV